MNNTTEPTDESRVEELLRGAGKRSPLPEDVRRRLESNFRANLAIAQRERKQRRWAIAGSIAASLLITVLVIGGLTESEQRVQVASVTRHAPGAIWRSEAEAGPIRAGNVIEAGEFLTTADGPVAFTPDGSTLDVRLAPRSEVRFVSASQLQLIRGVLYVDSGNSTDAGELIITANELSVAHMGTQYLVSVNDQISEIAVREGAVLIKASTSNPTVSTAAQGEQLTFAGQQLVRTSPITAHDPRFHWANASAPAIETNNLAVHDFLSWVCHQTGYQLDFKQIEPAALDGKLIKGSINMVDVFTGLELGLELSGLTAEIDDQAGLIVVQPLKNARSGLG